MLRCERNDIHMTRGDSALLSLSVEREDGEPYEIQTGDSVLFTIKKSVYDTAIVVQKKLAGGLIRLNPEDTKSLKYGTYYYDVELTQPNGFVATVIPPSRFIIEPEVTY